MNAINLSIIVLTASNIGRVQTLMESFLESRAKGLIQIQFVCLANRKDLSFPLNKTEVVSDDNCELVFVGNDRYFGSCEENLFRVRDFAGVLKPWVLVIGETDEIDWDNLTAALRLATDNSLDALLLNIQNVQRSQGGEARKHTAQYLDENLPQNIFCRALLTANILNSNVAYPALLSMYGPMDWLAFVGNQIFSRSALLGILKYRFTEHVYSFVYMQALYFSESPRRYQIFMPECVTRISDDFLGNKPSTGMTWLQEHRVVNGHSAAFHISNVYHLTQIDDEHLFMLISCSLCLGHTATGRDDAIGFARYSTLHTLLDTSIKVILEKLNGTSFYLNTIVAGRLDQEIWAMRRFFTRFTRCEILLEEESCRPFISEINRALTLIDIFFFNVELSSGLLASAIDSLKLARSLLADDVIRRLHLVSFEKYHSMLGR